MRYPRHSLYTLVLDLLVVPEECIFNLLLRDGSKVSSVAAGSRLVLSRESAHKQVGQAIK